jgi:hypothetical protein
MRLSGACAALCAATITIAAPASAANYLITVQGTVFAPTSANPIAAVAALGGQSIFAAFTVNSALANINVIGPIGGQGVGALWTGAVQQGGVSFSGGAALVRNSNDPGNIFLIDNGGNPNNANARQDQATISVSAPVTPGGVIRTYDVFGLPADVYLQSMAFGRVRGGTIASPPDLVTDVFARPDFPSYLFAPGAGTPFLSMIFRQGNPTSGPQAATLPSQQLSFGNLIINVQEITTGVPEPQSWAMLIAGFGLVGASLRRRRALAAA